MVREYVCGSLSLLTVLNVATYKRIARVDLKIPPKVSPEARDLITKVLISVSVGHGSWALILSSQLLQYDPEKRIALSEVRKHPWIIKYRSKSGSTS